MVCLELNFQFAAPLAVAAGWLRQEDWGRGGCWISRVQGEELIGVNGMIY